MKKIVIIGPESTGKSTLCKQLAEQYRTVWVEEYAREYLLKNGAQYNYENLLHIAKGQIAGEELTVDRWSLARPGSSNKPVFIDTDMYVMKVWCEFVFDKCHYWILNTIVDRKYDLYLLCNIDLPWVADQFREYPDLISRKKLYNHYKDIMVNQQVPWIEISGNYNERLQKAIDAVNKIV